MIRSYHKSSWQKTSSRYGLVLIEAALGAYLFKNTSLSFPMIYAIFWSCLLEKAQHLKTK